MMMLMIGCSATTPETIVRSKVVIVCVGDTIMFDNAEQVNATPAAIKRQILKNNDLIQECKKHEQTRK